MLRGAGSNRRVGCQRVHSFLRALAGLAGLAPAGPAAASGCCPWLLLLPCARLLRLLDLLPSACGCCSPPVLSLLTPDGLLSRAGAVGRRLCGWKLRHEASGRSPAGAEDACAGSTAQGAQPSWASACLLSRLAARTCSSARTSQLLCPRAWELQVSRSIRNACGLVHTAHGTGQPTTKPAAVHGRTVPARLSGASASHALLPSAKLEWCPYRKQEQASCAAWACCLSCRLGSPAVSAAGGARCSGRSKCSASHQAALLARLRWMAAHWPSAAACSCNPPAAAHVSTQRMPVLGPAAAPST